MSSPESLSILVRGYLESAGFKILVAENECIVADKLMFGQDRDTWIVWTLPPDEKPARYESRLRANISKHRPVYPEAKAYVLSWSRSGFTRDLLQTFADAGIKLLVPIQFFDAAFKVEEAPKAASAIGDIRSATAIDRRVPQPFRRDPMGAEATVEGPDLLERLSADLSRREEAKVRIVVGRAGIGKSFLFRSLFSRLYDEFLATKSRHGRRQRPIPLMPEHLKGTYALRTEALVENFLRTDVASAVPRGTFEWLLVNGFATWLLDGLDELYAGDPNFFEYVADLVTQAGSKAQITLWCRDSLLTTSDAFGDFRELCSGSSTLEIYRLSDWERSSKRQFAWLQLENRLPDSQAEDTPQIKSFLRHIDESKTFRSLSGLPFYCWLLLDQLQGGTLQEFPDDISLLNHVVDKMIQREIDKGLLDMKLFEPNGLNEWLEQVAVNYVEGQKYADIDFDEAHEYAELVLRDGIDKETRHHLLTSLLQFPLFQAGRETGLVGFAHDLIAEALAARGYVRALGRGAGDIGRRLTRVDMDEPTLLRFMSVSLGPEEEGRISEELRRGSSHGRSFAVLLTLLMLARPERNLVKGLGVSFEARNLSSVRFEKRDLTGISFRQADLSHTVFRECDLNGAQFEGAFINQTGFDGWNELTDAQFGDLSRVYSILARNQLIEDPEKLREWAGRVTGKPQATPEPCPTAQQILHLFGKYITPLGLARRDDLKHDALAAGKRFAGSAQTEVCIEEAIRNGYLSGPDYRGRLRRAEGDKYAEMVRFVRDGSISRLLKKVEE